MSVSYPLLDASAPPPDSPEAINWSQRLLHYKGVIAPIPKSEQARYVRTAGVALAIISGLFARQTYLLALTFKAAPWVVIGVVSTSAIATVILLSFAVNNLFIKKCRSDTPESRIAEEKKMQKEIEQHPEWTWSDVKAKYPCISDRFTLDELDSLFFARAAQGVTYDGFVAAHSTEAIKLLAGASRTAMKGVFLAKAAGEDLGGLCGIQTKFKTALKELGISESEIWNAIQSNEAPRHYSDFISRNSVGAIARLSIEEKRRLGESYLAETCSAPNDLRQYDGIVAKAQEFGLTDKAKELLQNWFRCQPTATLTLPELVEKYGNAVLDPLFLESRASKWIDSFIEAIDFDKGWPLYQKLVKRNLINENDEKKVAGKFVDFASRSDLSLVEFEELHDDKIKKFKVTKEVRIAILAREVRLGYSQFMSRNGEFAFLKLTPDQQESIRASFLSTLSLEDFRNIQDRIGKGKAIGIKTEAVMNAFERWFSVDSAERTQTATLDQMYQRYGAGVLNARFLKPTDPSTKRMVSGYLANWDFEDRWMVCSMLIPRGLMAKGQIAVVNTTKADLETLSHSLASQEQDEKRRLESILRDIGNEFKPRLDAFEARRVQEDQSYDQDLRNFNIDIGFIATKIASMRNARDSQLETIRYYREQALALAKRRESVQADVARLKNEQDELVEALRNYHSDISRLDAVLKTLDGTDYANAFVAHDKLLAEKKRMHFKQSALTAKKALLEQKRNEFEGMRKELGQLRGAEATVDAAIDKLRQEINHYKPVGIAAALSAVSQSSESERKLALILKCKESSEAHLKSIEDLTKEILDMQQSLGGQDQDSLKDRIEKSSQSLAIKAQSEQRRQALSKRKTGLIEKHARQLEIPRLINSMGDQIQALSEQIGAVNLQIGLEEAAFLNAGFDAALLELDQTKKRCELGKQKLCQEKIRCTEALHAERKIVEQEKRSRIEAAQRDTEFNLAEMKQSYFQLKDGILNQYRTAIRTS